MQSLSVLEAFDGITSCKIFCPFIMFHHFTVNCICLMLFLHELEQVLVLVKQFTSASSTEKFLSSRYVSHDFILFPISCLQTEEASQSILYSANKVVHLARCETQDLCNTDTSDMNESQSWFLPSLNFLSADLSWLNMHVWLFRLNFCLHRGETQYDLNNWCFWLLNILNHKWLQIS